jgi:hypothetical protein
MRVVLVGRLSLPGDVPLTPTVISIAGDLPAATEGEAYSETLTASGGTEPYTWDIIAGALPAGLSLTSINTAQATISGTPTEDGTFNFTVEATDANLFTGTRAYSLVVGLADLWWNPVDSDGTGSFANDDKQVLSTATTGTFFASRSHVGHSSGRFVVQFRIDQLGGNDGSAGNNLRLALGLVNSDFDVTSATNLRWHGGGSNGFALEQGASTTPNGYGLYENGSGLAGDTIGPVLGTGRIFTVYVDLNFSATQGWYHYSNDGTGSEAISRTGTFNKNGKTFHAAVWMRGINSNQHRVTVRTIPAEMTGLHGVVGLTFREWAQLELPGVLPWIPADLSVPFEWFDADADLGLISTVSSAVSEWASATRFSDGAASMFSQTASGNRPTLTTSYFDGKRAVLFNGTDQFLEGGTDLRSFAQNAGQRSIVACYRPQPPDESGANRNLFAISRNDTGARALGLVGRAVLQNEPAIIARRLDEDSSTAQVNHGSAVTGDTTIIYDFDWTNGQLTVSVNGTAGTPGSGTSSGNTSNTQSANVRLGCNSASTPSFFLRGAIQCIVFVRENNLLSTANREKIEGFLAHRLGMADNLPGGHPYKSAAPTL